MRSNLFKITGVAIAVAVMWSLQASQATAASTKCSDYAAQGASCKGLISGNCPPVGTAKKISELSGCGVNQACCADNAIAYTKVLQAISEAKSNEVNGPASTGEGACTNEIKSECGNSGDGGPSDSYSYACRPSNESCTNEFGVPRSDNYSIACKDPSFPVCCRIKRCSTSAAGAGGGDSTASASAKPTVNYTLQNPLGTTSLAGIMGNVIKVFLGIVGALALLVFAYGGIVWMTARGDAGQVKTAQAAIKNGMIGLFVIAFAYTITSGFVKMLTTGYVPGTPPSARSSGGEDATKAQQEQTSLEAQQKAAADAAKAQADEAKNNAKSCPVGYTCFPTNSINPDNLKFCQQTASGNSEECGVGAFCCNFNQ